MSALVLAALLLIAAPASAQTIVLSFMTGATGDVAISANAETLVWNFNVYPPASPMFATTHDIVSGPTVCPGGCPDYWAVLLMPTTVTVLNEGYTPAIVTASVYSDNTYVYQQRVTVAPGYYQPIVFGALSLGYILNSLPNTPMPVKIAFTSTQPVKVIRDTQQPTAYQPGAARVWGAMVELRPM